MSSLRESTDRKYELAVELTAPVPTPEQIEAREIADSWRAIADFIENRPGMAKGYLAGGSTWPLNIPFSGADARLRITEWVRAARAAGASVEEWADGDNAGVLITFGRIVIKVFAATSWLMDEPAEPRTPAHRPLLGDDTSGSTR